MLNPASPPPAPASPAATNTSASPSSNRLSRPPPRTMRQLFAAWPPNPTSATSSMIASSPRRPFVFKGSPQSLLVSTGLHDCPTHPLPSADSPPTDLSTPHLPRFNHHRHRRHLPTTPTTPPRKAGQSSRSAATATA